MDEVEIEVIYATPKGLRHSFVLSHLEKRTPLIVIQKLIGWASTDMLRVYEPWDLSCGNAELDLGVAFTNRVIKRMAI